VFVAVPVAYDGQNCPGTLNRRPSRLRRL